MHQGERESKGLKSEVANAHASISRLLLRKASAWGLSPLYPQKPLTEAIFDGFAASLGGLSTTTTCQSLSHAGTRVPPVGFGTGCERGSR